MTRGDDVTYRARPEWGVGRVCRDPELGRLLVTFPHAPDGPFADLFSPGELKLAPVSQAGLPRAAA